ncbi:MAG: rod shape-determining protein MreC [Neisseria sp.]|nr:rod shape-determining protein MreC [Neisseria sp.]
MSKRPSFTRERVRPAGRLAALSLVSIILMVLDNRYAAVQQLRGHLSTAIQPLQWLANQPVRFYEYGSDFMQSQKQLLDENKRLQEENTRLKIAVRQTSIQKLELAELKKLSHLTENGVADSIAAEVVSNGKDPLSDKLIINKGGTDGLKAGDAVIDQNGLIGQLTSVQPFSAELTILTNGRSVIPVMVERTGVRSLLYGDGSQVRLRYFPTDADLRPDDILVTSGLDSVYPAGIPVARVLTAQRASGTPYYRTTLLALAQTRSSRYVLILPQKDAAHAPPP